MTFGCHGLLQAVAANHVSLQLDTGTTCQTTRLVITQVVAVVLIILPNPALKRKLAGLCSGGEESACGDESWSGASMLWLQVSERCDWQPQSDADCDDQKVEPGSN